MNRYEENYFEKFDLTVQKSALLVIDIQDKLSKAVYEKEVMEKNAAILVETASILDVPTIFTEQNPKGLGGTNKLILSKAKNPEVIGKMEFNGYTDELKEALEKTGRKHIIVCGMETHICVFQTVRALIQAGYDVSVTADAVSSRTLLNKQVGLGLIEKMGGIIVSAECVMFDLMKTFAHPDAKKLQMLIK